MRNERVTEALQLSAARHAALTADERRQCDMLVVVATHLLKCCPFEVLEHGTKHKWRRDLLPAIGAPGCVCNGTGMPVVTAEHFLSGENENALAAANVL